MIRLVLLILIVPALACQSQEETDDAIDAKLEVAEQKRIQVIENVSPASVCIFSVDGQGGGSGVLIDSSGLALSNYHVVEPCGFHMYCGLNDGNVYDAVVVGLDPVGDVALIQLLGRDDFPAAELGDSDNLLVGQECFAVGNPFLLSNDYSPTITWGIVSGKNRYQYPSGTLLEYPNCIQTDAAINPGNSGGGLFSKEGKLVGINGRGSFEKRGRVNVGVGYAISINQVKNFLGTLKSGRILDHASLGFVVATGNDYSVRVSTISPESHAYQQGIRYDDELLSLAGKKIKTVNDVKNIVGTLPPHWSIPAVVRTEDETRNVILRLQASHSRQDLLEKIGERTVDVTKDDKEADSKTPANVKKLYVKRTGFANYFFQQQSVSRVVQGLQKRYNSAMLSNPKIRLIGRNRLDEVDFVMNEGKSGIKIGDEAGTINGELPFENQTVPARSGGFLNALHIYHELMFGDRKNLAIEYVGTAPGIGSKPGESQIPKWEPDEQLDVLRIIRDGTVSYAYVDAQSNLVSIEYFSFPNSLPCTVQFDKTISSEGNNGKSPRRIIASRAGKVFVDFEIERSLIGDNSNNSSGNSGSGKKAK